MKIIIINKSCPTAVTFCSGFGLQHSGLSNKQRIEKCNEHLVSSRGNQVEPSASEASFAVIWPTVVVAFSFVHAVPFYWN